METANWERLENIFHAALEIPFGERKKYLVQECAGNNGLAAEVEALIESFENESYFFEESVLEFGFSALHETGKDKLKNKKIGSYQIEEKIGEGGMGDVYRAVDTRLNRRVALKFLSEPLENDKTARRQLRQEAQAAAALDHPNICAVHGFEEIDGYNFIVMQFIEGKTLDQVLKDKELSAAEFKSIAGQIVSAVAFAHSHNIIHRDLKPGNIMFTSNGQIKILDFGLAKILEKKSGLALDGDGNSHFSQNGLVIGTVAYMSPEQLRGERIDYRSDIFSLGIIFYELLTKENPFKRKSQAETIAALLSSEPPNLGELKPELNPVQSLIEKCLHKKTADRFNSAAEILIELENGTTENRVVSNSEKLNKYFLKAFIACTIIVSIFAFVYFNSPMRSRKSMVVLPITLESEPVNENQFLADSLTQSIISKFSNLSDIKVKNKETTAFFKGKNIDAQTVGKMLEVDVVYTGNIQRRDNILYLTSKLIRSSDNYVIDTYEQTIDEKRIIELQEAIAERILTKLKFDLNEEDKNKFAKRDTSSNEANIKYLNGLYYLGRRENGSDIIKAIQSFNDAIGLDPSFAKAWTGLADAYLVSSVPGAEKAITPEEAVEKSKFAVKRALTIDPDLCEIYSTFGMINWKYDWNWEEAKKNFKKAIECNSELYQPHAGLFNVLRIEGDFAGAAEELKKAKLLDPVSISPDLNRAALHYNLGEFERAEEILSNLTEQNPKVNRIKIVRAYNLIQTGNLNEAINLLESIYREGTVGDKMSSAAPLGFAYAKIGQPEKALKIIKDLDLFAKSYYVPSQEKGIIYTGLRDYKKAFENLNKSCEERFSTLPALLRDPIIGEIEKDERFARIQKCINP